MGDGTIFAVAVLGIVGASLAHWRWQGRRCREAQRRMRARREIRRGLWR